MRLRQLALVATDLAVAEQELASPLGLEVCFRDPGVGAFGLHNALFAVGDTFLEIVSPTTTGTTAGRLLEKRAGDGGYMVIVQASSHDELARLRGRLDGLGVRVVWAHDVPATGASGKISGTHLHPRDVGGAIVSIDACDPASEWFWAGHDWHNHARTDVVQSIGGVVLGADDPPRMAARWADVLDRPLTDATTIGLDGARIRFVPAGPRGEGVDGIELVATDRTRIGETLRLIGTDIHLV